MEQQQPASPPGPAPGEGDGARTPQRPDLVEALRELRESGLAGLGAAGDAAKAMRELVAADVSLARSAAGRSAVFGAMAAMFGASAWLLLMTAVIVVFSIQLGLPWWLSLSGCGALSVLFAWLALRKAMHYFEHTRLKATRRQFARLGIGELSGLMPDPGSADSARSAGTRVRESGHADDVGVTPP
jgi:hypothetical protein